MIQGFEKNWTTLCVDCYPIGEFEDDNTPKILIRMENTSAGIQLFKTITVDQAKELIKDLKENIKLCKKRSYL